MLLYPYAMQDLLEVLLESARKGYWRADAAAAREIAYRYTQSKARHGKGGGLRGGGNAKLEEFVEKALARPEPEPAVPDLAQDKSPEPPVADAPAARAPPSRQDHVQGRELQPEPSAEEQPEPKAAFPWLTIALASLCLLCFLWGAVRRTGVPLR